MRFAIEKIFLWWLFYSVVGWVWETGLNLVLRKKWVDRGILNGPLCPIYGFGAASVIVLLHDVDNPIALFLSSGMLACTLEYFSSWAIEKLFHIRLWDYTGKPFNINGRIYLNGFLAFGIGAAIVKEYVQPWVSDVLDSWQPLTLDILTIIFTLILVTDISLTLSGLLSFDNRITQLQRELAQYEACGRERFDEKFAATEARARKVLSWQQQRLIQAFPTMTSVRDSRIMQRVRESMSRHDSRTR